MTHFDTVKDYDSVLPRHITQYFLEKKGEIALDAIQRNLALGSSTLRGLDLGCGTGDMVNFLYETISQVNVTGVDNSKQMLSHACRKYPQRDFVYGDIMRLPFPNGCFDFVIATNSLHHLASSHEQLEAFEEINRVMKNKSVFILNEMNIRNPIIWFYFLYVFPKYREFELGNEVHVKKRLLKKVDSFKIVNVKYYTFVPDFCPLCLFSLAKKMDSVLDRTPLASFGCHYTVEIVKG